MVDIDAVRALVTSIGENSVALIGKENLVGLQVYLDAVDDSAEITVSLRNNSDQSQREAIQALLDVEELFYDEAALSFHFVDDITTNGDHRVARALYSYA